jgi:hypothetical protein
MKNVIVLVDSVKQVPAGPPIGQLLVEAALPAAALILNTVLDGLPGLILPHPDVPTPARPLSHILELRPHPGTGSRALFEMVSLVVQAAGLAVADCLLADELVQVPYNRYWRDGVSTPGPKIIWLARKRSEVSRDYFVERWRQHALMVWRIHVGIWRYAQNVVEEHIGEMGNGVDGVAITHYRSVEDLLTRQYRDATARREVLEDVSAFTAGAEAYLTEELILRSPNPVPEPLRQATDVSPVRDRELRQDG